MKPILELNTSILSIAQDIAVAESGCSILCNSFEPQEELRIELLTDMSRLPEIYDLRLNVWEHSGKNEFVNRKLYPNGWYDELDDTAYHWVVFNEENRIVASARLHLFYSLQDFPYYKSVRKYLLPRVIPFAFYSRLVVDPAYRQNGLSRQLYADRSRFCEQRGTKWSQVFINNPVIIKQYERSGYINIGQAEVAYHPSYAAHSVNVLIKENIFA
ncbi:MAG: GNAT family N-acetyltransferase [Ginsengibacter sp.]